MSGDTSDTALQRTPLYENHVALGARMVPFTGYEMPLQYSGIMAEHTHTRASAGLFDVSHMGQTWLKGPDHETTARALETLVPGEILGLEPGQQRYTQLLNADGGILDDLMVTRPAMPELDGWLYVVLNAACKDADRAHIAANLPDGVTIEAMDDVALMALQGPKSEAVLERIAPGVAGLAFMSGNGFACMLDGEDTHIYVSRSGYSGEDGYEISCKNAHASALWSAILAEPEVEPVGLGARDSLRLEAGLCLYGNDIDETTSPVEAGLLWSIGKRRRTEGGFPGAARIQGEIANGATRRLVGLKVTGRAPARQGTVIAAKDGSEIGTVTSGGFGPTVEAPVAMGYVAIDAAKPGTEVDLMVRGRALPATVEKMPFITPGYKR